MLQSLMLVPSFSCPARCCYCFGPRDAGPAMGEDILRHLLGWLDDLRHREPMDRLNIVFHGGEPLTAGTDFFRRAFPRLHQNLRARRLRLNVQSNLWLLTDELCELFVEYGVSLGTSLDGPEDVTDAQRGLGYFRRTIAGIQLARRHGLKVGCICTFTPQSATRAGEVVDFFIREGLDFSVHAAVHPLVDYGLDAGPGISSAGAAPEPAPDCWALSPEAYGDLLVYLLDFYLANPGRIRISTLDLLSRSISSGEGGICTYRDCLGDYLAVAPDGGIYPCQRFAGLVSYRLARVQDRPRLEQLEQSPVWQLFREREGRLSGECGGCPYFGICRGGCPYNALAARAPAQAPGALRARWGAGGGRGSFHSLKDPYCPSYRRIFSHITERALAEVFSEENMEAVVAQPGGSLLRRGPLLAIMRGVSHPGQTPGQTVQRRKRT